MRLSIILILSLIGAGQGSLDQVDHRFVIPYCVMDSATAAIGLGPLRSLGADSTENELRVWLSRGREPNLLVRVTKQHGEVVAQFVAFEETFGDEVPGLYCDLIGSDVGVTVLVSHTISSEERGVVLHHLLAAGVWTLPSSKPNVALGNSMSLILERHNKGRYSIDAHDNPETTDGPNEAAACRIVELLEGYAAASGLQFRPDSCDSKSGGLDPNYWLNLTVRPVTARACARSAPGHPAG